MKYFQVYRSLNFDKLRRSDSHHHNQNSLISESSLVSPCSQCPPITTNLIAVLILLPFLECHINAIKQEIAHLYLASLP